MQELIHFDENHNLQSQVLENWRRGHGEAVTDLDDLLGRHGRVEEDKAKPMQPKKKLKQAWGWQRDFENVCSQALEHTRHRPSPFIKTKEQENKQTLNLKYFSQASI